MKYLHIFLVFFLLLNIFVFPVNGNDNELLFDYGRIIKIEDFDIYIYEKDIDPFPFEYDRIISDNLPSLSQAIQEDTNKFNYLIKKSELDRKQMENIFYISNDILSQNTNESNQYDKIKNIKIISESSINGNNEFTLDEYEQNKERVSKILGIIFIIKEDAEYPNKRDFIIFDGKRLCSSHFIDKGIVAHSGIMKDLYISYYDNGKSVYLFHDFVNGDFGNARDQVKQLLNSSLSEEYGFHHLMVKPFSNRSISNVNIAFLKYSEDIEDSEKLRQLKAMIKDKIKEESKETEIDFGKKINVYTQNPFVIGIVNCEYEPTIIEINSSVPDTYPPKTSYWDFWNQFINEYFQMKTIEKRTLEIKESLKQTQNHKDRLLNSKLDENLVTLEEVQVSLIGISNNLYWYKGNNEVLYQVHSLLEYQNEKVNNVNIENIKYSNEIVANLLDTTNLEMANERWQISNFQGKWGLFFTVVFGILGIVFFSTDRLKKDVDLEWFIIGLIGLLFTIFVILNESIGLL
ncbi:MAG TPA: hypothetical protein PLI06_00780 [Methanofastidiosum sp.]|nr:hypothetical protein [Methanofastidiosum sp.]